VRADYRQPLERVLLPPDTNVRVRLIETISESSKPGDVLQGVTADPVLVDSQPVVPNDTRALLTLKEIQRPKHDFADVTLQLTGLIFKSGKVQVNAGPVKARLQFLSDVSVLTRSVVGIIGGAMGAAGNASIGNPDAGAATVGGLSAGAASQSKDQQILVFKITDAVDLTGTTW
jgi:hypothetical protein